MRPSFTTVACPRRGVSSEVVKVNGEVSPAATHGAVSTPLNGTPAWVRPPAINRRDPTTTAGTASRVGATAASPVSQLSGSPPSSSNADRATPSATDHSLPPTYPAETTEAGIGKPVTACQFPTAPVEAISARSTVATCPAVTWPPSAYTFPFHPTAPSPRRADGSRPASLHAPSCPRGKISATCTSSSRPPALAPPR